MRTRFAVLLLTLVCTSGALYAAREFVMPETRHATELPRHDSHKDERTAAAAEPYDTQAERDLFQTDFERNDYLPVYVVISNDNDEPLQLSSLKVQLVTADKTRMGPAEPSDLYRRLSHKRAKRRIKLAPLPIPTSRPDMGVDKALQDEVENSIFQARAVEPRSSRAGFFFFDIRGVREPIKGARLFITGVARGDGQQLMFFEVPLSE